LQGCLTVAQARYAADGVEGELVAVHVVEHHHVEGGGGGAFFLVAAHVQVGVVVAAVGEAVDQPGVAVISEDDGFVAGEQRIEGVVEAVGGGSTVYNTTISSLNWSSTFPVCRKEGVF